MNNKIISQPNILAKKMAEIAKNIKQDIKNRYFNEIQKKKINPSLKVSNFNMAKNLIIDEFTDFYAQIIPFSLLFTRLTEIDKLQFNSINSIIHDTFPFIMEYIEEIDNLYENPSNSIFDKSSFNELIRLLKNTNIESIIDFFINCRNLEDHLINLYENFLSYYDPQQKINRGVFYTPTPVVSFIVKSVDELLKLDFKCKTGLADDTFVTINKKKYPKIQIIDPAVGTGTFLLHVIDLIFKSFKNLHQEVNIEYKWNEYVENILLYKLYGFELLLTPLILAHLKLGLKLLDKGYLLKKFHRLGLFNLNVLESSQLITEKINSLMNRHELTISEERKTLFNEDKHLIAIMLGNPPYSKESQNNSKWIKDLLKGEIGDGARKSNYFSVDGKPLGEKNPKNLNDDYVKFIRFCQWYIERTGRGILAFVTNHGFIDNPTFRGMRQQLMKTFDKIYILDLHGNKIKKERCPNGSLDENIFDIRQGISIEFFIKTNIEKELSQCKIYHHELFGKRKDKYQFLLSDSVTTIKWKEIKPSSPYYFFIPFNEDLREEYESYWNITRIMPISSVGIDTARDHLVIQNSPDSMWEVVQEFESLDPEIARKKYKLRNDVKEWKLHWAQEDLRTTGVNKNLSNYEITHLKKTYITSILYRPFNVRYTYYTGKTRGFCSRPRNKIMKLMKQTDNLGLIISRNSKTDPWRDVLVTDKIIERGVIAMRPSNSAPLFPLLLKGNKFNFSKEFKNYIIKLYNQKFDARKIFSYIYCILHSPNYRKRYENYLQMFSFPNIPFPTNKRLFKSLSKLGDELISLHLDELENMEITTQIEFIGEGDNMVNIRNLEVWTSRKLNINKTQYFSKVSFKIFNFTIGNYRILEKWLKDHQGHKLTSDQILYIKRMILLIEETLKIMSEIDDLIENVSGWPLL